MEVAAFAVCFLALFQLSQAEVVCYRKYRQKKDFEFCSGIIKRRSYDTALDCCDKKGSGFAVRKLKVGKNRFRCTPCKALDGPNNKAQAKVKWAEWGTCSVSCGAGWRTRYKECEGCDKNNFEENAQSQPCMVNFYCPVHGMWGPWFPWQPCTASCDGGVRRRIRRCNYPPPTYGGDYCEGDEQHEEECNKDECPVDGRWSKWSDFTECSATCGIGVKYRHRECNNPAPVNGGRKCRGSKRHKRKCSNQDCPVDGAWSSWLDWSACDVTCGTGHSMRIRSCDHPAPAYGGKDCDGDNKQIEECDTRVICPVDGGWTDWELTGSCRAPRCGKGYQFRTRSCTNPTPRNGGKQCDGNQHDRVECEDECNIDGGWCSWNEWSSCSMTCSSETSLHGRQRKCECPTPITGGVDCKGQSMEVKRCKNLPTCSNEASREEVASETNVTDSNMTEIPGSGDGATPTSDDEDI